MKPPETLLSTAENKFIMTKHDKKYNGRTCRIIRQSHG